MEWKNLDNCYRACLPLNLPPEAGLIYRSSNNMCPQFPGSAFTTTSGFDCDYSSHDVVVVGDGRSSQYLLAGALTAHRSLSYFTVRRRSGRMTSILVEQPDIKPGEKPEEIMVKTGSDWRVLLKEYAAASAAAMGVKPIQPKENLVGYCTWYYYYADVSEANFLENVNALAAHPELPFSHAVAQIDDGYQAFQGDWNDQGDAWKTPLKDVAAKVAAHGMTPGIWLMPFQASTVSRVFREHPDWFVKDEVTGQPKIAQGWSAPPNDKWACLDATQPAVLEHLANTFKTFHDWGFRYFKLDGMGFALQSGVRSNPEASPVAAFRAGLKAIREAVPNDYILGCTSPFTPCLGFYDGIRISRDTRAGWKWVQEAWREIIARFWMVDTWFRCDPDALIARTDRGTLSLAEARFSIMGGIITGVSITSDNLDMLPPERMKLLTLAANLRLKDPMPLDWPIWSWPHVIAGTVDGKKAAAVFNWEDKPLSFTREQLGFAPDVRLLECLGAFPEGVPSPVVIDPHDALLFVAE